MAKTSSKKNSNRAKQSAQTNSGGREVKMILAAALMLFLELCFFNVFGQFGTWVKYGFFGVFGLASYILPVGIFLAVLFLELAQTKRKQKMVCGVICFICLAAFLHLVSFPDFADYPIGNYFTECAEMQMGGGIIGGILALGLSKALSTVGAYIVTILAMIVCLMIICEFPVIDLVRNLFRRKEKEDEYEAPDKIVVPRKQPQQRAQEERYVRPRREQESRYDRPTEGYDMTSDDEIIVRLVHSNKKHKRPRAQLIRSVNKARSLRGGEIHVLAKPKARGVSDDIGFTPQTAGGDEIHEITRAPQKEAAPAKAAVHPEVAVPVVNPEPERRTDRVAEKMPEAKETRALKKPSSKVTTETKMTPDAAAEPVKRERKKPAAPAKSAVKPGEYVYPPLSLLKTPKNKNRNSSDAELDRVSRNLEKILSNFGVEAKVIDRQVGPSVTRYELQPEMGTRVSKITNLVDDLKLNLAVSDMRIEAPIPGRAAIGIEIPNPTKETVMMRTLLEEPELINHKSKIAFAAGIDISGNVIVSDIAKMPHLLVAGTTGSGKSTFVNTILMALLYRAKPSELGLIIIDPKKIEFGMYSGIPHLVKDVVTDPGQAVSTLRWAVNEMSNRYQRMQLSGVRDFKSYNDKFDKGTLSTEEENPKRMPQIVIIIDELADLMMVASKEAEALICRLAQLARAAGIHLIIATQRPSVDVVTGLIKANIPARVALLVASQVDSRTIIDMKGAEDLLGHGDMLFYPSGYPKPVRVQGAFVSEEEVENVVAFLKQHKTENYYEEEAKQIDEYINNSSSDGKADAGGEEGGGNGWDEYLFEAGKLCINAGKASSSMLQRRFSVGFNRAARIIDQLTEMGAVGPANGSKPREILVDIYQFEEMFQSKE